MADSRGGDEHKRHETTEECEEHETRGGERQSDELKCNFVSELLGFGGSAADLAADAAPILMTRQSSTYARLPGSATR